MIVCHCRQLTDSQVRRAVREGARSLDDLGRACGAGVECGGCRPELARLISVGSVRPRRERLLSRMLVSAGAACVPGAAAVVSAAAEAVETVGSAC